MSPLAWGCALLAFTVTCVLWVVYTLPPWATALAARLFPDVLFFAPASKTTRLVALTIDDSVDPVWTPQVCDLLRSHGAHATFFVIGQHCDCDDGRAMLTRMLREGHELGNHTWLDRASWRVPIDELKQEMVAVERIIDQARDDAGRGVATAARKSGGGPPRSKWFRPGHGFFTSQMLSMARALGYRTALGSVFPHDPWVSSWRLNSWMVLHRVRPGGIVILHDGRPWLLPTLREVLPRLAARGFRVVTLSELVEAAEAAG